MRYDELHEEIASLFLILGELGYVEIRMMPSFGFQRAGLVPTEPECQRLLRQLLIEVDAVRPRDSMEAALADFDIGEAAKAAFVRFREHVLRLEPKKIAA